MSDSKPDMPSSQNREEALFQASVQLTGAERAAFLNGACLGDTSLRQRLEALLAAHDQPDSLAPTQAEAARPTIKLDFADAPDEAVGQTLGRYKLLERVGEGGCGVVYVAEQTEPVRRRVALKVIKLGMDTKQVVARFEAERQALAMMDHPNIAKVLDAGTTDVGRPFFVMELVRGIRITDYCDQANLPTKERLDLFIKVCQAIQHAHQKGIIHRDIKPSNILVTLHDGAPVPKVIDFGIAKATEGRLTDNTVYTQLHQFIGTPAYMSPEQAEMSGLDIDTRSDIYSLGVLLYELLAGVTPFDAKELMAQGIDAMRKTIREKEPPRPSTRLTQRIQAANSEPCSKSQIANLKSQIHSDLDWIVMKCLEKDRTRRYETASGLAADIGRHLTNEPVVARPPSTVYKLRKALRRNRLAYASGTAVVLALLIGVVVSTVQANRARKATALATARLMEVEEAKKDAEQIIQFLQQVFESPDPGRDGRTITVAESLDRAARRLETELVGQPERRAHLQRTLAGTYSALGLYSSAIPIFESARTFLTGKFGQEDPRTIQTGLDLVDAYDRAGRSADGLRLAEETRALSEKVNGPEHTSTLWAMHRLANVYDGLHRDEEAVTLRERVLALRRKSQDADTWGLIAAINNLGVSYLTVGRVAEAIPIGEEARKLIRELYGTNHFRYVSAQSNLGITYSLAGRNAEALRLLEEAVPSAAKLLGSDHPSLVLPLLYLGWTRLGSGQKEEALKTHREGERIARKAYGTEHPESQRIFLGLNDTLSAVGRYDERLQLWSGLFAVRQQSKGLKDPSTVSAMLECSSAYVALGKLEEAAAVLAPLDQIERWTEPIHFTVMYRQVLEACLGERISYEAHRRKLVDQFASATAPFVVEWVAKGSLLLPLEGPERQTVLGMAERAFQYTNSAPQYFAFTGALAKYRAGEWATAVQRAERSLELAKDWGVLRVLDRFVIAMAYFRMSRVDEARAVFANAREIMQRDYPSATQVRDRNSHDILIAHVLYREAKELIEPRTP